MPRNVRNFWLELEVDGKKEKVATGPRSADGGFYLTILIRETGDVSDTRLNLEGRVMADGTLAVLCSRDSDNGVILRGRR